MKYSQVRAHESGSLAIFVIVGLVLAALIVGGVYTIQKKDRQSTPQPTASPSVVRSPSTSSRPTSPSQKPQPTRSPSVKNPSGNNPLPATGPSDTIVGILMLAGFVGVAIAYVRSRGALRFAYQVD